MKIMGKIKQANSKSLECAARFLREFGGWENYKVVFHSMKYKNGNYYCKGKNVIDDRQLFARMLRHPAFKHKRGGMFTLKKGAYDEHWPFDPAHGFSRRGEKHED